ncbi:class I SAM-dependent methyltransferase [Pararhizobium haloflavum]|uniref:class I SAM-dependent methyltransferase n=1 Tax=Pararhizobium haloflavum TaxID=2037914 RepID=UPI000C174BF3|nr:class I SAM-dependent methyltransferase [Pararhizobium haloflavum]
MTQTKTMRDRFEEIYRTAEWEGGGSGEGSHPVHTFGYRRFLGRFLRENAIRSVVDLGCGDWQFSRRIDWRGIDYQGFDVVPMVVEANQRRYGSDTIRFELAPDFENLPQADLIIAKDVLQHWSNASILDFLPVLQRYRHALITNCVTPDGLSQNSDIADGDFRPVDLRLEPFSMAAEPVYSFRNAQSLVPGIKPRWRKIVLHRRPSAG